MTAKTLKILKSEDIRYIDGRYRDGFVDQADLDAVIEAGLAEIYDNGGMRFVRLIAKDKE